ncbi:MAG: hypothetical protein NC124_07670 [Clostridium sp.]|nr:hypothetical protein [Clostridium sp.]
MVKYKSSSKSIENKKNINKPNEDYFLCDDERGIYILVDGVSRDKVNGIYPNPSPSFDVSKLFVESTHKFLSTNIGKNISILDLLYDAIKKGNDEIRKYNKQKEWIDDFLPGTVGIVAIILDYKLFFAYIGDCYGLVLNESKKIFTKRQTEKIADHKSEFSAYEIRNKICNNKSHPYSYGVLNGDFKAMDFVKYDKIDIQSGDKIFLCSDGFSDIVENLSSKELYKITIDQMIEKSNTSDDKTVVVIEEDR